jgi:hypothetical protein
MAIRDNVARFAAYDHECQFAGSHTADSQAPQVFRVEDESVPGGAVFYACSAHLMTALNQVTAVNDTSEDA